MPAARRCSALLLATVGLAGFGLALLAAGCGSTTPGAAGGSAPREPTPLRSTAAPATSTTTTTTRTTTTTTTVPPTTTTLPHDPQPSSYAASAVFMGDWELGDRAGAQTVGSASAVATIFAHPYDGEVLNDRGCSSPGPNPVICSWGPYALASPTNPLYEVTLRPEGQGWYVSGVLEETSG